MGLVLSFKLSEQVMIDVTDSRGAPVGRMEVMVTEIRGKQVKLRLSAPKNFTITREKVLRKTEGGSL